MPVQVIGTTKVQDRATIGVQVLTAASDGAPSSQLVIPGLEFTGNIYQVSLHSIATGFDFGKLKALQVSINRIRSFNDGAGHFYNSGRVFIYFPNSSQLFIYSPLDFVPMNAGETPESENEYIRIAPSDALFYVGIEEDTSQAGSTRGYSLATLSLMNFLLGEK